MTLVLDKTHSSALERHGRTGLEGGKTKEEDLGLL